MFREERFRGGESMNSDEMRLDGEVRMRPAAEWKGCCVHIIALPRQAHNPVCVGGVYSEHLTGRKPITGNGSVDSACVVTLFTGTYALCYRHSRYLAKKRG